MSLYITPEGQIVQNQPVVELDENSSILLTDGIGRQTIVTLQQQPVRQIISQPSYIIPSYLNTLPTLISSTYEYQDINEDKDLHTKVMKTLYTSFYNSVIPNQFPYLLNYVKNSKNNYIMVKNQTEYKKNKTAEREYESKLKYLSENVYPKSDMYSDVKKYLNTNEVKWFDIDDNKKEVYEMLVNKLRAKLENLVRK
jgi:hypothetical protein